MNPLLVTQALAAALPAEHRGRLAPLGTLKLKGKEVPVAVFGAR